MKTTRSIIFLLIVLSLNRCRTPKEVYYSYTTRTYLVDSIKQPLYIDNLISYGNNYLFEFRTKINMRTNVLQDSSLTSVDYDTIGVYLLSGAEKLFYEFDTFALESKIVNIGKLENKPFGQKITFSAGELNSNLSYGVPEKIVENNIPCFEASVIHNDKAGNDSIQEKILLIKKPKFNSLYKINGIQFPDKNYCIVGFEISDLKQKQSLSQEVESMRPLKKKDEEICEAMAKKVKLQSTDSIKKGLQK